MKFRRLQPSILSLAALVAACLSRPAMADNVAASAPAGYITLKIAGTHGNSASALSFLGLGLVRPALLRGRVDTVSGRVITDNGASWSEDQYNGPAGSHYLELTSGPGAGLTSQILATDAASRSLSLANDLSAYAAGGVTYVIRKNWTLADVFGAHNEAGLGAGSVRTADHVLVYNASTRDYSTYYYKTAALPLNSGTGWRSTADDTADAANTPFAPSDGLLVRRRQPANLQVTLLGAVKLGATDLPVSAGLNILNTVYPGQSLTLGNSGLYTGDTRHGLRSGDKNTADQVMIYNAKTRLYRTYYYQAAGPSPNAGGGWRSTDNAEADASDTPLAGGSSLIVNRVADKPFDWIAPQPFVLH